MNFPSNSSDYLSSENWSVFSEVSFPCDTDSPKDLGSWLSETCRRLYLPDDLCSKLLPSVENAVRRAVEKIETPLRESIHIVIFLSINAFQSQGTWGFFQIEKTMRGQDAGEEMVHRISLYLYREG